MELLTVTLAANQVQQFAKAGRYFEIITCDYAVNIDFTGSRGNLSDNIKGAISGLYLENPFSHFAITNGSTAQTIVLLVMETGRGGSRRQPGNVRVIDQSSDKTLAGAQFFGGGARAANAGSALIGIQSNAVKRCAVKSITVSSTVAGTVLIGTGTGGGTLGALASAIANKLAGAAASTSLTIQNDSAAASPTVGEIAGFVGVARFSIQANTAYSFTFPSPIVLQGTNNLIVSGQALNRDVAVVFDIEEV